MSKLTKGYGSGGMQAILDDIKTYFEGKLAQKANTSDLGTAASRNATNQITAGSTALPEAGAVKSYVDNNIPSITGKADKVINATSGHLAGLDSNGNLTDSGVSPSRIVQNKIYGFHIDSSESDPDACVTYLDDAVGMTPAHMDYSTGEFNYGSWENAFFMPRPCMLKFDGTVDYYLDPNDYSKKEDGTASDVADDTYGGNAMMEWGKNGRKIWYKVIPDASDATSGTIKIANYQVDSTYHAWSFINMQGNLVDHFYTPIYNGTIVDGKLRSISGKDYTAYCKSKDVPEEITAAEANNPSTDKLWYTEVFSDIQLINSLLVLMGKSLDTQTVFGEGRTGYSWNESLLATTGGMDNKGLFYGESTSQGLGVKVFGMEHWWGNQWRRYAGHINDSGTIKIKLTYGQQDGSTVDGYNTTASGYLTVSGCTPAGTNGVYADKAKIDAVGGILTYSASGSDQHYYSDGLWFNNGQRNYALRGGHLCDGRHCGAFYLDLADTPSYRHWYIGAALSCKPLANKNESKLDKSDVADIEGDTASKAYSVNDFMLRADGLYKVTAPIASGASITSSNTTKTTIGAVLTALLNS